jgi:uncharacterized membrane protein YqjE
MSDDHQQEPGASSGQSDLSASLNWIRSLAALGAAVLRLGIAEISLAKEDLGRLILVCLIIVPVLLLTWVSLGVLVAWIVFELTMSATLGFASFAAIQLATSVILVNKIKTYRRSLTLPATRAQILTIIEEVRHETRKPAHSDREA